MNNFNSVTKEIYSLNNQAHLEEHKEQFELSSDEWAGFKQWKIAGRKVVKGAKGCKIFIVCEKKMEAKEGEETKKRQVVIARHVYNLDHTEKV